MIQVLFGGIIGIGVVLTFLLLLMQRLKYLLTTNFLNIEKLHELMAQMQWKNEVYPLIDEQLDALTVSFKEKHPMIGMFLTPTVADPLKEEGKAKLIAIMPTVEDKLARYLCKDEVAEKLETYLKKWLLQKMPVFLASGFGLGAIFGLFLEILLKLL